MKKMAILFAALAALATLSGVAFANNIHDGTGEAILSAHQTDALSVATQPAITTKISNVAIASNAFTPFQVAAPKDVAANATTSEVKYEPKFPNLVLSATFTSIETTATKIGDRGVSHIRVWQIPITAA